MELRVQWRRMWQPRQYESEEIVLSIAGTFDVGETPGKPVPQAQVEAVAIRAAELEHQILDQLAEVGDRIMAARLEAPDPRGNPWKPMSTAPARQRTR